MRLFVNIWIFFRDFSALPRSRIRWLAAAILCGLLSVPSPGQTVAPGPAASLADFSRQLWSDTSELSTAPANWDSTDWVEAGAAGAGIVGTALLLDRPVRNYARDHRGDGLDRFANHFEKFGAEYSFGVIGAFYVEGWLAHDDRNRVTAEDALDASILSGVVAAVLKETIGRSRPSAHAGVFHFKPFSGSASFPSGHATQAFALAGVISARFGDRPWIDTVAYGSAALVGTARIYHQAHFASDVLAGALIGNAIGRMVVHHRDQTQRLSLTLVPYSSPTFKGLGMACDF